VHGEEGSQAIILHDVARLLLPLLDTNVIANVPDVSFDSFRAAVKQKKDEL
jgi:hypothetical protein